MASLAELVPEIAAFQQAQSHGQQQQMGQLQQMGALQGILAKVQAQQEEQQLKGLMAQHGGDPEKTMKAALASGNTAAAAKLAPIVKMYQEQKQRQETADGMRAIYGQPVAAPAGQVPADAIPAPAGTPPPAPIASADPKSARMEQLKKLAILHANNPTVSAAISAQMGKLEVPDAAPKMRSRIAGDQEIQEEFDNKTQTWKQVGSGPRFARQVAPVVNVKTGGEAPVGITEDTLAMDAYRYLTDGTLPPNMGRGVQGSAQAAKIRNEASRLAKEMGMAPDEIRFSQLTNKAQVAAIAQLGRARAQILQAEKLASENASLALAASEKADRTGVPLLNRGVQWAQENLQGDPRLREFTAANETFISEYAKVMGGGYGAAAPTEGAQARAHTILNRATTKEEYRAGVAQLRLEMANRKKSLDDQMNEERGRLRSGIGKPTNTPAPSATPAAAAPAASGWSITPVK